MYSVEDTRHNFSTAVKVLAFRTRQMEYPEYIFGYIIANNIQGAGHSRDWADGENRLDPLAAD